MKVTVDMGWGLLRGVDLLKIKLSIAICVGLRCRFMLPPVARGRKWHKYRVSPTTLPALKLMLVAPSD